ncbi:LPS export ABC transporter periplasmic protein LptC [Campylobacter sp. JMF_06 NA1]|uniref:LPS export ABC transporter periplasmic protein LptC n=1 Tax=Campylobacter sp. JMF_06 NA1 TaxID=2983823 RepID=UPI0022E9CBE3|nr:LPS export ABC transporter periplasmic protein LptC [Campylobacter sp. JMF_06 NA1]MDA3077500.1 LPS export ABC transporter periplasmic protein LptC [Campylobacter sp. JMF_06 NA1]
MVIKIFYVVIAIFSVAMVFLSVQTPYFEEMFKENLNVSNLEMQGVRDYQVGEKITGEFRAKNGIRYKDRDEFYEFDAVIIDDINHTISSNLAVKKGDNIKFSGSAHYRNSDEIDYKSEQITYNLKNKIVRSDVPYTLTQGENKVTGEKISYDTKNKKTNSKGIHAWYYTQDKNSSN